MVSIATTVHHEAFTDVDGDRIAVRREDYRDPGDESGVILEVAGRPVMLTIDEAKTIAAALRAAADRPRCERCNGSGVAPGTLVRHECTDCEGTGRA